MRVTTGKFLLTPLFAAAIVLAACEDTAGPSPDSAFASAGQVFNQVDRFGLPAIATVFIPTAQKDAFNQAIPSNDRSEYLDEVIAVLQAFGHPDPAGLAAALLPDVQPINTSIPSAFLNGRRLQDDVITAELGLIFGGNAALNDDHVDANDRPFRASFPYLADPTPR